MDKRIWDRTAAARRTATSIVLWTLIILVAAMLAVTIAYRWHGSLEEFPTAGQQDKIAVVSTWIGAVLAVVEAALIVAACGGGGRGVGGGEGGGGR